MSRDPNLNNKIFLICYKNNYENKINTVIKKKINKIVILIIKKIKYSKIYNLFMFLFSETYQIISNLTNYYFIENYKKLPILHSV